MVKNCSCLLQNHYTLWAILIRYCSQHIITKVTFCCSSITKLLTVAFLKFFKNLFLWIAVSLVILNNLGKNRLILKNQYVRKIISLLYICRDEFSFIRIILNIWRKIMFLFQLSSKFWDNIIWPMKVKFTISMKIFFRKTL